MTQTTQEVFEKYEIRKTKKQKSEFISFVEEKSEELGYDCYIEKGSFGARNIVVGDVEKASVIYTAHYDTCPVLPFPNFITPKNFGIYLLYQILITLAIFIPIFISSFLIGFIGAWLLPETVADIVLPLFSAAIALLILTLFFAGPANKHTANDNTSGVTTLLDIMHKISKECKEKVAFVFFDLEEAGLIGSQSFASKHKNIKRSTLLVNFDCVSDGENLIFAFKRGAAPYIDDFKVAFSEDERVRSEFLTKGVFYPSDQANFKCGVGVAALKRSKRFGILYMDKIHTKHDTVYREENIDYLSDSAVKLAELMADFTKKEDQQA